MKISFVRLSCILLVFFCGFCTSDVNTDKEKCANQVIGLATCLPYVSGESKAPPKDCCTGLRQVIKNSKECICLLVKDRDDPSLGLKINATLALGLPDLCNAPANISDCPSLLHLAPNSPDAKVFEDFANSAKGAGGNTTTTAASPTVNSPSGFPTMSSPSTGGGERKHGLGIGSHVSGFLLTIVAAHHILRNI